MTDEIHPIDEYIQNSSWRLKENANHIFCVGHMMNHLSSKPIYDYWINKVFTSKIKDYHESGRIHIHDLSRYAPYCCGFSTSEVIKKGLKGPKGRIDSVAPKHLSSAINQLTNFVGVMSQEFAGAIALNDFSLYLAPFVYYDKLEYKRVKQEIQQFVFHMNQPNRWAGECPFSNVTLSLTVPEELKNVKVIIGGVEKDKTYSEFVDEMNMINEVMLDILHEGDANGTPMTFPVITIGVTSDFPWDSEIAKKVFQITAKYGTPFFENFNPGTGRSAADGRSMCCRLRIGLDEIKKHTGGLFGHGDSMGSIAVATINLNRIGYETKTKEDFYKQLTETMEVCKDMLELRRKEIVKAYDMGMYPYTKIYLKSYKTFFSTIGIIGANEAMMNFMKKDMMDPEAIEFMSDVLDYMNSVCLKFQKETGNLYNLEAVPGEGCMCSLAIKDKKLYKDIYTSGKDELYLTNSTQPSVKETNFLNIVKVQEELQTKYSGGTTLNIYLGEKMTSYKQAKSLVKTLIEKTKLPYFSITPTYSICKEHGYLDGEQYLCPTCKHKTEVFSRVVGYLKPTSGWNKGKKEEYDERKMYILDDIYKIGEVEEDNSTKVEIEIV